MLRPSAVVEIDQGYPISPNARWTQLGRGQCQLGLKLPDIPIVGYFDTMNAAASKVGRRGTVVLPAKLRRRLGIEEGSFVVAEQREDGILIRPATRATSRDLHC
jgi:AbrB family looped-hinge helix DNA binding protein